MHYAYNAHAVRMHYACTARTLQALTDATSWVKVESEKAQVRVGGGGSSGGGGGGGAPSASQECKWSRKRMRTLCVEPPPSPPSPPDTWWAACRAWGSSIAWYDVWLPATGKVFLLNAAALFSVYLILRAAAAHR